MSLGFSNAAPGGPFFNLPAVEPHEAHQGQRLEDGRLDVPEVLDPGHDTHQVDEQDRVEADVTLSFSLCSRVQLGEELGDAELIEEAEELVEELGVAEAVDLVQVLAISDAFCDTSLVLCGGEPDQALGGTL